MKSNINLNTGENKNIIVALALWFFLGYWSGAHNYYLERYGAGIAQFLLFIIGICTLFFVVGFFILLGLFIWWVLDLVTIFKVCDTSQIIAVDSGKKKNKLDEIEKLHSLFEAGALTKKQYEEKKQQLLDEY